MEFKATGYQLIGRVGLITLQRPDRGNAWTGRMHAEYKHLLSQCEADPEVGCVVLTGAGWAFCVGGDATALSGHALRGDYDDGLDSAGDTSHGFPGSGISPSFEAELAFHYGLTKPVIAAINGPAAGIGLALACFADLRFAVPGAALTCAHGKLNLPAEYGLSWILPRHIGLTRAMDLLLTSRRFSTEEAHQMGLINQLIDPEDLLTSALDYAEALTSTVSAGSLAATRHQVYLDQHRSVGESVDDSRARMSAMMAHPDYRKGVEALTHKRAPEF